MSRERNCAQFAVVMVPDRSLVARLAAQVAFAAAECRRDPAGFARALWEGDAFDRRDTRVLWSVPIGLPLVSGLGFGLGVLLYSVLVGVSPVLAQVPDLTARPPLLSVPLAADAGAQRSPGGGGGGDLDSQPVSRGVTPPSSLADPVTVATTHDVRRASDPLPVPPPIKAPPVAPPIADRYGDPLSGLLDPSDGPGTDGGAGAGRRGGWGPGEGPGEGPGREGGRGDGPFSPGTDGDPVASPDVASRAVILNAPRPSYTEAARQARTEGVVKVRVLLGADGRARRATVLRGLPNGLDEKAIEAVGRLQFRPARDRAGRAVDSWVTISVAFSIR